MTKSEEKELYNLITFVCYAVINGEYMNKQLNPQEEVKKLVKWVDRKISNEKK